MGLALWAQTLPEGSALKMSEVHIVARGVRQWSERMSLDTLEAKAGREMSYPLDELFESAVRHVFVRSCANIRCVFIDAEYSPCARYQR